MPKFILRIFWEFEVDKFLIFIPRLSLMIELLESSDKETIHLLNCVSFMPVFDTFDLKIQGLLQGFFLTVYRYSTGLILKFKI